MSKYFNTQILIITLVIVLPANIICQNLIDSLFFIYKSDSLIKVVNTNIAPKKVNSLPILDEAYLPLKAYGVLQNGKVEVYNNHHQLIKNVIYKDSVAVIEEIFKDGKITSEYRYFPKSKTYIITTFFEEGNIKTFEIASIDFESITKWHKNGNLKSICTYKYKQEKCDYWNEKGVYSTIPLE